MNDDRAEEFDALYEAEFARLAGALALACGDRNSGEELAQEAFVRAWTHWRRVRTMERPAGWLYATGFNLARRHRRRMGRPVDPAESIASRESDAVDSMIALQAALAALPHRQRSAVVARFVLGLDSKEAAAVLKISPDALRATLHRAVDSLRKSSHLVGLERT